MFDLCSDDVPAVITVSLSYSSYSEVVGFSATGQENDFGWDGVDKSGDFTAGLLDGGLRALSKRVHGLRVAHLIGEVGQYRFDDFGCHSRGRAVVEIHLHKFSVQGSFPSLRTFATQRETRLSETAFRAKTAKFRKDAK
jgi:hypothetical protein